MRQRLRWMIVPLALVALLAIGSHSMVQASAEQQKNEQLASALLPNYLLSWDVVGGGGSQMSSSSYRMHSTVGQPAIGRMSSATYQVHSGFWQRLVRQLFLPLVRR